MPTWNRVVVCCKWENVGGENRPSGVNAIDAGESWQDITNQPVDLNTGNVITTPNLYLIEVFCWEPARAQIAASPNHLILARQEGDTTETSALSGWQNTAPEDYTINNFDNTVTLAQASTFKTQLQAAFPDINITQDMQEQGVELIREGITRQEMIKLLAAKWKGFLKAIS